MILRSRKLPGKMGPSEDGHELSDADSDCLPDELCHLACEFDPSSETATEAGYLSRSVEPEQSEAPTGDNHSEVGASSSESEAAADLELEHFLPEDESRVWSPALPPHREVRRDRPSPFTGHASAAS